MRGSMFSPRRDQNLILLRCQTISLYQYSLPDPSNTCPPLPHGPSSAFSSISFCFMLPLPFHRFFLFLPSLRHVPSSSFSSISFVIYCPFSFTVSSSSSSSIHSLPPLPHVSSSSSFSISSVFSYSFSLTLSSSSSSSIHLLPPLSHASSSSPLSISSVFSYPFSLTLSSTISLHPFTPPSPLPLILSHLPLLFALSSAPSPLHTAIPLTSVSLPHPCLPLLPFL